MQCYSLCQKYFNILMCFVHTSSQPSQYSATIMISPSQNKCILICGILHKSFARCKKFQIKNILEKFKFVDEFKVCLVCLKYGKDCRCVSDIKNQFRGKDCKHCGQRHHYLLCQTDAGLLHSDSIRRRFLGLTKKRRKGKKQKNSFPG